MATVTARPDKVEATKLEWFQAFQADGSITIVDMLDTLPWFKNAADWSAWRAFLCAAYGLPMAEAEQAIYRKCTGRLKPPTTQAKEVVLICGRRARKSAIVGLMASWSGLKDYSKHLAPGERPWIPILAKNMDDAQQIKRFAQSILADLDWLQADAKAEEIRLESGVDLVIRAAKITAGRSRACPLAALDEVAFFKTDEAADPDKEIIKGIRPGMANIPGSMLVLLSSPYARRGALYEAFRDHYGKDGDVLVWQADTLTMHDTPAIRAEVESEYRKDPENARAEYGAQFRTDVVAYMTEELLDACTAHGVEERPPIAAEDIHAGRSQPTLYLGFVDVSGGRADSYTLAISHWDRSRAKAVLDAIREWRAPFHADAVTKDACELLKRYGIEYVTGDHFGGDWPAERFQAHGIGYMVSKSNKNAIYRDAIPAFTSHQVELLDHQRLRHQYLTLDRHVSGAGQEMFTHPKDGHDDVANAVTGAILEAFKIGKHVQPEAPRKVPKSLEELRARQHEEAWAKMVERAQEGEVPVGRMGLGW